MKTFKLFIALCSLFLFSCQKEISFEPNSAGGGGSTNGLLIKSVAVTGTDSFITLYGYDSQKRLETMTDDGTSNGLILHNYKKFQRDAAGRIVRILQKLDQNGISSDTAINNIHYPNSTTKEYDYSVNTISVLGFEIVDSSVYTFTSGKLASVLSYAYSPLLGLPPFQSFRSDFVYNASGNVSLQKLFATTIPGSPLQPVLNNTYTYGTAFNAMWSPGNSAQSYWTSGLPNTSNEAAIKIQSDDLTTPSNSFTTNISFVLSGNNPSAATTTTSSGQVTKYTFYYQ